MFHIRTRALLQWNSNPWTLLDTYYSKQVRGTTGIRTQTLLRGEKYVTDSQLLKGYISLICLMICFWDMLYFRSWNSRCLASVVRAAVVKSEPVIWKVMWRNLVYSTEASKMKIQKIVFAHFLPKTRLKKIRLGSKPWKNSELEFYKEKVVDTNRRFSCAELYELKWH